MSMSHRDRFAILRRDGFTCQYCGRAAPDVELEMDHVVPRSKGGSDTAENLVTSCKDCNAGKFNTELAEEELPPLVRVRRKIG